VPVFVRGDDEPLVQRLEDIDVKAEAVWVAHRVYELLDDLSRRGVDAD
jgi:hypothetical protein